MIRREARPANGYVGYATVLLGRLLVPIALACPSAAAAGTGESMTRLLRTAIDAACDASGSGAPQAAERLDGVVATEETPIALRAPAAGYSGVVRLGGAAEIRLERITVDGSLRRLTAAYWSADEAGEVRPRVAAVASGDCRIVAGRRLRYEQGVAQPTSIAHLDGELEPTGYDEPLNPPVPDGEDPGGITVAIVDSGVNYLLPEIGRTLARDATGAILGYDYWDLDDRPFDANPARSPFFPQRHGTRTASLLIDEAPKVRLVPYRYPRLDMTRMASLIDDVAAKGIRIVNLSMGSESREEWHALADAAARHPDILFVLSAGNDGRDIDTRPLFPASLGIDNAITVTSAEINGRLATGSNEGRESVDLLVPAERIEVTDFDGSRTLASGSSYAAIRITALAARMLAGNPEWRAVELKSAILARALPDLPGLEFASRHGFLPRPAAAEHGPPISTSGTLEVVDGYRIEADALYPNGDSETSGGYLLRPVFAYFRGDAWNRQDLRRHAATMATILRACRIIIPAIEVYVLDGPDTYRYFHDPLAFELVRRLDLPKPTIYFVRETLQEIAFEAEAVGRSNSGSRPALRDTVWVIEGARDPGIILAHELVHILADDGEHSNIPGNLMRGETAPGNTVLTTTQCDTAIRTGRGNGLLTERSDG